MKILHIIPSIAPVRGGPSQAILEMVKALRNLDIEAEIITTNDNGNYILNVPLNQWTEYQQVPVQFFARFSPPLHSLREFAFSSPFTIWLWQNISNYNLVHIHAIFSYTSTVAMLIARLQNIPYIVRPLGQLNQWSLQQSARKKQIYLKLIEYSNLNHSQALHLTSEQEQKEVSQLNLNVPSFILPHGISIPEIIPNAREKLREILKLNTDQPIILFMSRLHHKKGLDYLIPALGNLKQYPFTFILAGSGSPEYETEIQQLLETNNLQDRTYLTGFVKGEIKDILLQGADLFVLPSHSENFGIAVLEALAVGLPAIVTPEVALASIIQEKQVGYVTLLSIEEITKTIDNCLNNLSKLQQKRNLAKQLILEQYTWNQVALDLIKNYHLLLEK